MRITERIEVCQPVAAGGLVDVWSGMYGGNRVAIKVARVAPQDDFQKIRKVGINADHLGSGLNHPILAILQGGCFLESFIPPEHLETCWGSGRHGDGAIRDCFRMDGAREHHALHQGEPR